MSDREYDEFVWPNLENQLIRKIIHGASSNVARTTVMLGPGKSEWIGRNAVTSQIDSVHESTPQPGLLPVVPLCGGGQLVLGASQESEPHHS